MLLTSKNVECLAVDVLEKYKESLGIDKGIFKVQPIHLAKILGLKLLFVDFGEESEVLGFTSFSPMELVINVADGSEKYIELDGKTIVINSSLKNGCKGRFNFTVAHEIAHHILNIREPDHYGIKYRTKPQYINRFERYYNEDEVNANMLASALLMPKAFVCNVFKRTFGLGCLERLHSVLDRYEFLKFRAMSELFGVSKEALAIRLQKLGLLKEYANVSVGNIIDIFPDVESKTA